MKEKIGRIMIPLLAAGLIFSLGYFLGRRSGKALRLDAADGIRAATAAAADVSEAVNERGELDLNALPTLAKDLSYPVDLNAVSLEELMLLPGIGPTKAQAIIDYRNEHGPFQSVGELTNVPGIGKKTVDSLLDCLTVGEPNENSDH